MVFQFTSWVCTWLRVGGLWTNWRLKRRTLARSHIHPIQACAQCPANHLLIPRTVFLHMTSLPGTAGSIQRFPGTPPTQLNTTECYFRCRRWSANTRSSSSSAHTGFNLQSKFITMLAMIWWSLILVWWSVRLLYWFNDHLSQHCSFCRTPAAGVWNVESGQKSKTETLSLFVTQISPQNSSQVQKSLAMIIMGNLNI